MRRLYMPLASARMRAVLGAGIRLMDEHEGAVASGKREHRLIVRRADALMPPAPPSAPLGFIRG
ncbi:hypothetical protein F7R21_31750 [Burkholderia latens]|uniref:Uncharacterized protein n=1 Tax=Burkholderia latens TaxID=488446 RepID=A0A6H9TBS3_9BURK|nr:hypothetical protein F7R21_31750 [Burkholderia latens]